MELYKVYCYWLLVEYFIKIFGFFFLLGNLNNKERDILLDVEKGEENRRMNDIYNVNGKEESIIKGLVLG